MNNQIRIINAMISYYLHIPQPEELSDDVWAEKWRQVEFLVKEVVNND